MKITIYELLGLIKDGKVPKKIKWSEKILVWDEKRKDYVFVETENRYYLFLGFETCYLNDEVEIIEEKPKHIEEIKAKYTSQVGKLELANKINELSKAVNYLLDKEQNETHKR